MSTFLITQATGGQSKAVITHLLKSNAKIHALVRNPQNIPDLLKHPNITVFQGETADFDAVYKAAQGCDGIFLNTFPIPGLETKQAQTVVDVAKARSISFIVASTTFATENKEAWDNAVSDKIGIRGYYASKASIEETVVSSGLGYTILQPGFIDMDFMKPHVLGNFPDLAATGDLIHSYNPDARMCYTDVQDIGKVAAAAFLDPAKYSKQKIGLISESLTIKEVHEILERVSEKKIGFHQRSSEEVAEAVQKVPGQKFMLWANETDFTEIFEKSKKHQTDLGLKLTSLEDVLVREKESFLNTLPA